MAVNLEEEIKELRRKLSREYKARTEVELENEQRRILIARMEHKVKEQDQLLSEAGALILERYDRVKELEAENDELKDFCIWMTGCGYVFTQHKYFCEQRDKLLKDSKREGESFLDEEVMTATIPDDFCYECKSTSCKCEEEQG